jgi:hypothetical protein
MQNQLTLMTESNLYRTVCAGLDQILGGEWPRNPVLSPPSYRPTAVYIRNEPYSWIKIWQEYLLDNGDVQIVCQHSAAQIWFVGSETEGCRVYSLSETDARPAPYEKCETVPEVADALKLFLGMATRKRKASRMSE